MKFLTLLSVVLLPMMPACGGDSPGACGQVALKGAAVPESAGAGAYPSPAGGPITNGTYVLSKIEVYPPGSVDSYQRRSTLLLSGGKAEWVMSKDGGPEDRWSGGFSISGMSIDFDISCPAARSGKLSQGYTSTATELTLFAADGSNELGTYTKQ